MGTLLRRGAGTLVALVISMGALSAPAFAADPYQVPNPLSPPHPGVARIHMQWNWYTGATHCSGFLYGNPLVGVGLYWTAATAAHCVWDPIARVHININPMFPGYSTAQPGYSNGSLYPGCAVLGVFISPLYHSGVNTSAEEDYAALRLDCPYGYPGPAPIAIWQTDGLSQDSTNSWAASYPSGNVNLGDQSWWNGSTMVESYRNWFYSSSITGCSLTLCLRHSHPIAGGSSGGVVFAQSQAGVPNCPSYCSIANLTAFRTQPPVYSVGTRWTQPKVSQLAFWRDA